jgi:hypothetical protein
MPLLKWEKTEQGLLTSAVISSTSDFFGAEAYRDKAEKFDSEIDDVIDEAVSLIPKSVEQKEEELVRRWVMGRAISDSNILYSTHMVGENRLDLWDSIARKCRLGVRSSGEIEISWYILIPDRIREPRRTERDVFNVSLWLQMQELQDAIDCFGGNIANIREIRNRESLRSVELRNALGRWRMSQTPDLQDRITVGKQFILVAKALRSRWPSRGPGSAERPEHFSAQELDDEIHRVLKPIINELLSES